MATKLDDSDKTEMAAPINDDLFAPRASNMPTGPVPDGTVIMRNFMGAKVRIVLIDGAPWFVGKDVAEALGYSNPQKAVRDHCRAPRPIGGERNVHPHALDPQTVIISEPDMLRLIVGSTLPSAERFERWVFEDVLPSIRKTGAYSRSPALPNFADPVAAARAWADAKESEQRAAALAAERAILIEQQKPKVDFHDRYAVSTGNKGVREVAKLLGANERQFVAWLERVDGPMYRLAGVLTPKAQHMGTGRFVVKAGTAEHGGDSSHAYNQAKFTPKGVTWIAGEWGKRNAALAAAG